MKRDKLIAPNSYNLVDEIEQYANDAQRIALHILHENDTQTRITYKTLIEQSIQLANAFIHNGLQKGDVILMMVPRSFEAYALYIGALKAGLVIIPSSEMLRAKDIEYRMQHAGVKAVVSFKQNVSQFQTVQGLQHVRRFIVNGTEENWQSIFELAQRESKIFEGISTTKDDLAFLAYTSGTTGQPKAAMHAHSWAYAHIRTTAKQWLGVEQGDIVWATAAPGWQKWIWSPFLATLGSGATAFVYTGAFDAARYLTLIEQQQINVLCCTPTEYRMFAKEPNLAGYRLQHLRSAVSAGEPLNAAVVNRFQQLFQLTVRDGYGQTENTLLIGALIGEWVKPGSMGKATPGNRVAIVNEDGQEVQTGEVGHIAVHQSTAALFLGYLHDEARTKQQFKGEWYMTGDRAAMDEDGYFWFEGRSDDIIISSGYTIGPFEVEDALIKHPYVKECAVVASPDEVRGAVVKAFVVLTDSSLQSEETIALLQQHTKALTAPYKYPRKIEFVESLPKTVSGKIRRVELRAQEYHIVQ